MKLAPTPSEALLWKELVNGKPGVSFRRQVVVDGLIADFIAPSVSLIVEVDRRCHTRKRRADARRDDKFAWVLRVKDDVVRNEVATAVARVVAAIASP